MESILHNEYDMTQGGIRIPPSSIGMWRAYGESEPTIPEWLQLIKNFCNNMYQAEVDKIIQAMHYIPFKDLHMDDPAEVEGEQYKMMRQYELQWKIYNRYAPLDKAFTDMEEWWTFNSIKVPSLGMFCSTLNLLMQSDVEASADTLKTLETEGLHRLLGLRNKYGSVTNGINTLITKDIKKNLQKIMKIIIKMFCYFKNNAYICRTFSN